MKRHITIVSWIILILMFYPVSGQCINVDFRGQVSSLFIMRDVNGFQYGFMDHLRGMQWRNTLEFDLTLKPEYRPGASYYLEKVFMSYRGSYDAIFECRRDAFNEIREKSPADYELGKDDIEWENDLREIFVDLVAEEGMTKVNLRLGRQIVRWGETDSFNVINVPNPNNNSYQMFFSNPDDMATPLWMARMNYNVTGAGVFDSVGFEFLAIPDIRPTLLAPLGDHNDRLNTDAPYAFIFDEFVNQGLGGIITIKEDVAANTLENMEYGISLLLSLGDLETTLHYFVGYQDDGVFDWIGFPTLEFKHPRQRTYGFSFNYFVAPLNGVLRGEGAYTDRMHLGYNPTGNPMAFPEISSKIVDQVLLGFDKDLHPKWIGTTSALISAFEFYWKHIEGLEVENDPAVYATDKRDSYILTCLFMTDYHHGMIKPMVTAAYDVDGVWMTRAAVGWDPDGKWLFELTQMSFWGRKDAISQYTKAPLIENSELSFKVSYRF